MFRWIANLFTTPESVTVEELLEQADAEWSLTVGKMANHIYCGGRHDDEKMVQLRQYRELLESQVDGFVSAL